MTSPHVAAAVGDACGEGLVCVGDALYWADINRFLIHRFQPETREVRSWSFEEPVVALAQTEDPDLLLVALASRLVYWRAATDERTPHGFHLDDYPRLRLNDGRAAPDGRFWVGSMFNNVAADGAPGAVAAGEGTLYAIGPSTVTALATGLGVPNTLCWSPDLSTFYFGDTLENDLRTYAYDRDSGAISLQGSLLKGHDRGLPDGSAIDAEGYLWNCRYGGGCVLRIAPDGSVDRVVALPVTNVTTCAFAGPENRSLFITTASAWPDRFERQAGHLFCIETDVPGSPEFGVRL